MTNKEVMQMALAALIEVNTDSFHGGWVGYVSKEIEALRAALAQPEPEPVAQYSDVVSDGGLDPRNKLQREWVGLTDE